MTIYDAIKTFLKSSPYPLAVQDRVYMHKAPDGAVEPYLVVYALGVDPIHAHTGTSGLLQRAFQFSSYSSQPSVAFGISDSLRHLINGFKGTMGTVEVSSVQWTNSRDFEEPATRLWHVSDDYDFQWVE